MGIENFPYHNIEKFATFAVFMGAAPEFHFGNPGAKFLFGILGGP